MQDYNPTILSYLLPLKTSIENGLSVATEQMVSFGFKSYDALYVNVIAFHVFTQAMLLHAVNTAVESTTRHATTIYEWGLPWFHSIGSIGSITGLMSEWLRIHSSTAQKTACSVGNLFRNWDIAYDSETLMTLLCCGAFIATLAGVFDIVYRIESTSQVDEFPSPIKKSTSVSSAPSIPLLNLSKVQGELQKVIREKRGIPISKMQKRPRKGVDSSEAINQRSDQRYNALVVANKELTSEIERLRGDCACLKETNETLTAQNTRLKDIENQFEAAKQKSEQANRQRLLTTQTNRIATLKEARERKKEAENKLMREMTERRERYQRTRENG